MMIDGLLLFVFKVAYGQQGVKATVRSSPTWQMVDEIRLDLPISGSGIEPRQQCFWYKGIRLYTDRRFRRSRPYCPDT